jgi:hypothetical protein
MVSRPEALVNSGWTKMMLRPVPDLYLDNQRQGDEAAGVAKLPEERGICGGVVFA